MRNNNVENEDFNSFNLILFLYRWRKLLIIFTLAAAILSFIFTLPFFITPKFRSSVILFPTSSNSVSKALLSENADSKQDILEFGYEEQTEQMLQMLNSNKIRDRIIKEFDLMKHYDIDPNSSYKNTKLNREYDKNITFRRTEFMAVEIAVLDKDPQMAADIANNIANLLDSIKNEIQHERAMKGYKIVADEYLKLRNEIKVMEDSMTILRKLGVHDYETQVEMINQQLAKELAKNNRAGIKALDDKLNVLALYGGPYVSLRDALENDRKQLSLIKSKYEEAKIDAEEVLPQKFIVNSAFKAERKSYPIRWLIVLVTTVSSFLLISVGIIVYEQINKKNLK